MRKITVLDFANQIGILSDEVPVIVKNGQKGHWTLPLLIRNTGNGDAGRARSEDRPCHSAIRRDHDSGQAESSHDLNRY